MSDASDRDALEDTMTRFVLDELDREEAEAFERLLAARPELAREVASLRRALGLLPYATVADPPPALRGRVLAAAARVTTASGAKASVRRVPWGWLAAAASLVAGAVVFQNLDLRRQLQLQDDVSVLLQQPNVVLSFALAGSGTASRAFGRVVLDLDAKKGAVVIRRLPALGPEQVYRLWARIGREKVLCGEFGADADGTVMKQFPVPVDAYTAPVEELLLTVESSAALSPPTGPTVMIGS